MVNVSIDCRSRNVRRDYGHSSAVGKSGRIRYAEHIVGGGEKLFEHATSIGLEGIISKRRDLPYEPGRSDSWRKSKVIQRGVFVIGGMTDPEGTRVGLGALLVGTTTARASSLPDASAPASLTRLRSSSASGSIRSRRSRVRSIRRL